jgi:phosphate uptake regulator
MEHGIEAGSTLGVHPSTDGTLLIQTLSDDETPSRSTEVSIATDDDEECCEKLYAAYTLGTHSCVLTDRSGHSRGRRQVVERSLSRLPGFEILETTETRIRIRNLIEAENVDIRKITLRLKLTTLAMHRDAIDAVVEGDEALARQTIDRDNEVDKLFALVMRYFRRSLSSLEEVKQLGHSRDELFEFYYTARQLERVADHAQKIAGFARTPDASLPEAYADPFADLGRAARTVVDDATDVVLTNAGIAAVTDVLADRDRVVENLEAVDRELYDHDDPGEAYVLGLLLDSLYRTAEYGANTAEVALQRYLRSGSP